jgi:hypothetical protein
MCAGLQRRLRVLVVEAGRARDEADVEAGVDDVSEVFAGDRKPPFVSDALECFAALSADGDELDFVAAACKVRKMGGNSPRAGPDDA